MFLCECGKDFDTAIDLSLHQREFHSGSKNIDALTVENAGAITASHQPAVAAPAEEVDPSTLKGKLADGFPGKAALEAAELGTYAKLRHAIEKNPEGWYTDVEGVGDRLSVKIAEAVGAHPVEEEE